MGAFSIKSESRQTTSALKQVYAFLTDFKNFGTIMPADRVEDFSHDHESCTFTIRGITQMTIRIAEQQPYKRILFTSGGLAKFNFDLEVLLNGDENAPGECTITLHGNLNPIIKAMAEKPLRQLVDTMAQKLAEKTVV